MANPLQVMTFNVRYGTAADGENRWELRRPRALSALTDRHPDLVGLQEALDFQLEELAQSGGYVAVGVGREDGRAEGEHAAILYDPHRLRLLRSDTFWLSDTPHVVGSSTWDNRNTRICTWAHFHDLQSGASFYQFNTHLDHEIETARDKGVALILRRIADRAPAGPVIVTGDFNAGETSPAVDLMRQAGFRDSFRVLHPNAPGVTFNDWQTPPAGEKIDYIFVDPETQVLSAEILDGQIDGHWLSDHMPLITTITLK